MRVLACSWIILIIVIFDSCNACKTNTKSEKSLAPPVRAPFKGLDLIASIDWWNREPNEIINVKVNRDSVVAFGSENVLVFNRKQHVERYR